MLFLLLTLSAFANVDQDLQKYIQEFEMAALDRPAPKREAIYKLGARLFRDPQLSGNGNINCLDCHTVRYGTGDTLPLSVGEGSFGHGVNRRQNGADILLRNTPPLYNLGLDSATHLFWDGRVSKDEAGFWVSPEADLNGATPRLKDIAATLDSVLALQALFPIADPKEMLGRGSMLSRAAAWENVLKRLFEGNLGESYQTMFQEAFGTGPYNIGHVGNALAEFQRHAFWSGNTPWDQYLKGNVEILSDEMKAGALVFFGKGQCANCHGGQQLSAFDFDGVGTPQLGLPGTDDVGRMAITGLEEDRYMFRVSPLRNISVTAPYMHNGVFKDLWEVIEFYDMPEKTLMDFVWRSVIAGYDTALTLDKTPENQLARLAAMAEDLPRDIKFTEEEEAQLWCFLTVAFTDMSLQRQLQGVENENPRCHPVLARR
jgi:cytochrome c peroxidase